MEPLKKYLKILSKKTLGYQNPMIGFSQLQRSIEKKIYTKKYSAQELLDFIIKLEINTGDTIMVQTSWNEFYNFEGKIGNFISGLEEIVGPSGNICMPGHSSFKKGEIFNAKRTPTIAGLIPEYFRRKKGVKRSIHYNSSVCVLGPDAEELISGHEKSLTSWDKHSPYFKLYKMNAKNLTLGLGQHVKYVTTLHCVDSILRNEIPFYNDLFGEEFIFDWKDKNGNTGSTKAIMRERGVLNSWRINHHLNHIPIINGKISNLDGYSVPLEPLVDKAIDLGRKGITIYWPPFHLNKNKFKPFNPIKLP